MTTGTELIEATVERVAAALAAPWPVTPQAAPVSLEGGIGAALFLVELARRDPARLPAAHALIAPAARALAGTASVGLSHGPAPVLAAVQAAARIGPHYPQLRHTLTGHLASAQLARVTAEPDGPGVGWSDYDVITGPTGTGRLLLAAVTEGDQVERAAAEPALRATLDRLVALSRPVTVDGRPVPGWWVPSDRQATDGDRRVFPRGDVNLGLAHGIAGPLALLARSAEEGVTVGGQLDAVHRIAEWLAARADHDAYGPAWEPRLGLDAELARADAPADRAAAPQSSPHAARFGAAWCYGAVGIATALYRAGRLTGQDDWCRLALHSAHALGHRPGALDHLQGPTVCHGLAGLLQSLWRLARLAEDEVLLDHCAGIAEQVARQWDPAAAFGYRHVAPADRRRGWELGQPLGLEENPGVLEGAAGVAAALLSTLPGSTGGTGEPAPDPVWDRVLLLS
ncbi:lanthionine synthetase C family protein [Kitasatospora sp. NPDC097643]|uniref:lanthionine synthetase C family protein n=1 Tax=Kitasatospora sp. NPDC097643 TaxID=3157230 RepID=UPI003328746A